MLPKIQGRTFGHAPSRSMYVNTSDPLTIRGATGLAIVHHLNVSIQTYHGCDIHTWHLIDDIFERAEPSSSNEARCQGTVSIRTLKVRAIAYSSYLCVALIHIGNVVAIALSRV